MAPPELSTFIVGTLSLTWLPALAAGPADSVDVAGADAVVVGRSAVSASGVVAVPVPVADVAPPDPDAVDGDGEDAESDSPSVLA